tara:strand:- start:52 stop:828 length:777 start_codon:yes stop_codon:yes gene_type:complete
MYNIPHETPFDEMKSRVYDNFLLIPTWLFDIDIARKKRVFMDGIISERDYIAVFNRWFKVLGLTRKFTNDSASTLRKIHKLIEIMNREEIKNIMYNIKQFHRFERRHGRKIRNKTITMKNFLKDILFSESAFRDEEVSHEIDGEHYWDYDVIYPFLCLTFESPCDANVKSFKADVRNILQDNGYIDKKNKRRPRSEKNVVGLSPANSFTSEQLCRRNQKKGYKPCFTTNSEYMVCTYNTSSHGLWKNIKCLDNLLRSK